MLNNVDEPYLNLNYLSGNGIEKCCCIEQLCSIVTNWLALYWAEVAAESKAHC